MAIENLRLKNLQQQIKQKSDRIQVSSTLAYQATDPITGEKQLTTPEGGVLYAVYLGNSDPGSLFTSFDGKNINQVSTNTDPTRRFNYF